MKKRSLTQKILLALGLVILVFVAGVKIYIWQWDNHSSSVGHHLVKNFLNIQKQAVKPTLSKQYKTSTCVAKPSSASNTSTGLLLAPSISLQAPVMQGNSDAILAVAVGHDPYSVWPGNTGRAVLQAHDVSYFVNIDELKVGSEITYETFCKKYTFQVVSHQVVKQGSPVYDSSSPTMTLVTCWPTNALWFTPDRYLVNLKEIKVTPLTAQPFTGKVNPLLTASHQQNISVPAPSALVAQGLTLNQNSIPMGKMTIKGNPNPTWVASPAALDIEAKALESYIGAVKSLEEGQIAWWHLLAPKAVMPTLIAKNTSISYLNGLGVTIYAHQNLAYAVKLQADISISGQSAPRSLTETVLIGIHKNLMTINSLQITPLAN
jgi:sortase A